MDACRYELADDREHALAVADEVFELRMAPVENRLRRERAAFVEIQKRLMRGIVRKESRGHGHRSGDDGCRVTRVPSNRLPIRQGLSCGPGAFAKYVAAGGDLQSPAEQRQYCIAFREKDGRVENLFRGVNAKLVGNVEHMSHKRELNSARLNADIEVAEWHRVRHCVWREAEDQDEREQRNDAAHSPDRLLTTQLWPGGNVHCVSRLADNIHFDS